MTITEEAIVIIGGGLAGAKAAEGARSAGFAGRIVVIGDEPGVPYERPPLSKAVLRGEADVASTEVHPQTFYDEHGIEILSEHRATRLRAEPHLVELADGTTLSYGRAVLATGAEPRSLDIVGAELDGVHQLRTAAEAVALRDAIGRADRIAVLGAGWIGSEVAASARQMGAEVVLIDPATTPLQRVLGHQLGDSFAQLHAAHGVKLHLATSVARLEGAGSVERVVLTNGAVEPVDLVVVGIGVAPRTGLAEQAGLEVDNGVVVDEHLRTSDPDVYAAGDIANAWHPHFATHLRVEHWANALNQGLTAGRNAAGASDAYDRLPYFYSDQYDLSLEYVGHHRPGDDIVVRGSVAERTYVALWHQQGSVTAAMVVNDPTPLDQLKELILRPDPVGPRRLADLAVPLADLVG